MMTNLTSQFMMLTVLRTIREDPTTREAISAGHKVPVLQGLREYYKDSVLDASLESLGLLSLAQQDPSKRGKENMKKNRSNSTPSHSSSDSTASNVPSTSTSHVPFSPHKPMPAPDSAIIEKFGPHSAAYYEAREDLEKMLALNRQFFTITTHRIIYDHPKYREILALKELQTETQKDVERLQEANRKVKALRLKQRTPPQN
ncbi:hypothetical protein M408DRAFT_267513 [Serendipita vermifera MAFF 305830]|uniref:Uncharacterized protein n=1 Tax=Serendipita vermifera MAFF 305830 TaxID=933852 RepID=A0A0C3ASZ0_SERVB|nr:hypothetical protein M408DRAFT_267513 [Serendipita vermifera MAFF 305830]